MLKMMKKSTSVFKQVPQIKVIVSRCGFSSFQGQIPNSHKVKDVKCHCHGAQQNQRRSFFQMPKFNRRRDYSGRQLVGFTMDQMFEVVSDVENYHKFVPWCKQSLVLKKTPGFLQADLVVGFPPINESYTSCVTLVRPYMVRAECKDGRLFHHLLTLWRFSPGLKREKQSCVVDFQITFEFRSAFHSNLSNLFFDQVARKMENSFIEEVGRRYGPATMVPRNLLHHPKSKVKGYWWIEAGKGEKSTEHVLEQLASVTLNIIKERHSLFEMLLSTECIM